MRPKSLFPRVKFVVVMTGNVMLQVSQNYAAAGWLGMARSFSTLSDSWAPLLLQ